ncbi:MAG: FAD-dependent oxidoreductase [Actinomycetota bacterium]
MEFRARTADETWFDANVPCMIGCPVLTNAGRYVAAIAHDDDELSYLTARLPNPFPSICGRVCAAPCELHCRRGLIDEPIAIRALKRFACERHGVEGSSSQWEALLTPPPAERPERIAVIGAGPAGLACAHDLRRYGFPVTVFDAADRPGGMMVLGIPGYRLRRDVLNAEIEAILGLGAELRLGSKLGEDFTMSSLRADGYAAVFLGVGAMRSRDLDIPGNELDGVLRAVEFLLNFNLGFRVDLGERVIIIGGGNVAMDAARTAVRADAMGESPPAAADVTVRGVEAAAMAALDAARAALRAGAHEVTVVALESPEEMPAASFEIEEAKREGISFIHRHGPQRIVGDGRVAGLETLDVASVFDPDGRFNPRFVDGTEKVIECDSVILAIGQASDLSFLAASDGIEATPRGTIAVDAETLATSAPGVYAGGDIAFGPRNLIDAIADGRRAAASMLRDLAKEKPSERGTSILRRPLPLRPVSYDRQTRVDVPSLPSERRVGLAEVELGYTEAQAREEAGRCLECFRNIHLTTELCILCGGCVDICPTNVLRFLPAARIDGLSGDGLALVLEEDLCIRCGLCVQRCPTGALDMREWVGEGAVRAS